ncbi:hypothetical protein [Micavibrio aeruginosavorus]|uniref:hypothetical protein n=1 Tax=Micavibrio aeruginosavorus TaxID=349221 RepID=UPI0011D1D673|nr:hypothetical protein [Micavibrio aeruginosavorus]
MISALLVVLLCATSNYAEASDLRNIHPIRKLEVKNLTITELSVLDPLLGEGIEFAGSEQGGQIEVVQFTDQQGREFLIRNAQSPYSCGTRGCSTDFFRKLPTSSYQRMNMDMVTLPPYYLKTCGDSVSLLLYGGSGMPDRYPEWGYDEVLDQFILILSHETQVEAETCPVE